MNGPWRQDVTTPGTFGPASVPPGATPGQIIPVGSPPPSAGDPDLLPQLSVVVPDDISADFGFAPGEVMVFVVDSGDGARRAKWLDSVTWLWDSGHTAPFTCGQYILQMTMIPAALDPSEAITKQQVYQLDQGNNGPLGIVRGEYTSPIYIPPQQMIVLYVSNTTPAMDPNAGTTQRAYFQWRNV